MNTRKGQFFVIGAILLITLFFLGLPKPDSLITTKTEDIVFLFDNIEREYPFALNNALNMSADPEESIDRLMNFTRFTDRLMSERLINFSSLWVVSRNSSTSNINVTVGNYLKYNTSVDLVVCTTIPTCFPDQTVIVSTNTTNSTEFGPGVTNNFTLDISYGSELKNLTWIHDKVNMYALIQMQRGENLIKDELAD